MAAADEGTGHRVDSYEPTTTSQKLEIYRQTIAKLWQVRYNRSNAIMADAEEKAKAEKLAAAKKRVRSKLTRYRMLADLMDCRLNR